LHCGQTNMRRLLRSPVTLLLLLSNVKSFEALSVSSASPDVRIRQGFKSDEFQIATTMARELMNPLGMDSKRFLVAVNPQNSKDLYGWAQLRPIGPAVINPNTYDASPGSGDIEKDVINEEIWEEFENDDVDVPVGLASLPWTKEYREFAKSAAKRREKRDALLAQAEREETEEKNQLWELASVYVLPPYRGKGIGSKLVKQIMTRHSMRNRDPSDVYMLTLASTREWYESLGFRVTEQPPDAMRFEIAAGTILANIATGDKLICMQHR